MPRQARRAGHRAADHPVGRPVGGRAHLRRGLDPQGRGQPLRRHPRRRPGQRQLPVILRGGVFHGRHDKGSSPCPLSPAKAALVRRAPSASLGAPSFRGRRAAGRQGVQQESLTPGAGSVSIDMMTVGNQTRQGRSLHFDVAFALQKPHAAYCLQLPRAVQSYCSARVMKAIHVQYD